MDVAYKIDADGKLEAKNQVVLNQLTFGDRIESPDATKLPVLLAVALLKDRHGVIDINLPVSGSINDPQFSVGGIIWKVIVNLLTKALTAPFALLAGGGSDDLSLVEFKPGTAQRRAGRRERDRQGREGADRPAGAEDDGHRRGRPGRRSARRSRPPALEARLVAEQRREGLRRRRCRSGTGAPRAPPVRR